MLVAIAGDVGDGFVVFAALLLLLLLLLMRPLPVVAVEVAQQTTITTTLTTSTTQLRCLDRDRCSQCDIWLVPWLIYHGEISIGTAVFNMRCSLLLLCQTVEEVSRSGPLLPICDVACSLATLTKRCLDRGRFSQYAMWFVPLSIYGCLDRDRCFHYAMWLAPLST